MAGFYAGIANFVTGGGDTGMSFADQGQRKADAEQAQMLKGQLDKLIAENQKAFSTLTGGVLRVEVVNQPGGMVDGAGTSRGTMHP
jgi:hypothetical protein